MSKILGKEIKVEGETGFVDRFYRTLYDCVLQVQTSKEEFFGLLFKALRSDSNVARVMAFVRRLL